MKKIITTLPNYLGALMLLGFGVTYFIRDSFMPYHSDAVNQEWSSIEESTRYLILALMRAVSGGFFVSFVAIVVLQFKFRKHKLAWIANIIFVIGTLIATIIIYATYVVRLNTDGDPPTTLAYVGFALFFIGFVLNRRLCTKEQAKID